MRAVNLLLLPICILSCTGCVTVGQKYVGKNADEVYRVLKANFPVGSSIQLARDDLERHGYLCKVFSGGSAWVDDRLTKTDGMTCAGPHVNAPTFHIGGMWEVTLTQENGRITSQRADPFGVPYS
jgi:hypothetical protein